MDKVLGWIGEIFQTLLKMIPWLVVVRATHKGVMFSWGKNVRKWEPGVHWYWPIVSNYTLYTVVRQTQLIQPKITMTADLQTVIVGACITYHIEDIVKVLTTVADLASDVVERAIPVLLELIANKTLQEIQANRRGFNDHLTTESQIRLADLGISIHEVVVTELSTSRSIAIHANAHVGNYTIWATF